MGRFLALILCLCQLVLPVQAKEVKYVALTFDDGPSGKYTRALLDGLYDRGVNATFLLCGYRMKDYPELTQRIFDEGHEIGYHGYSHKNMKNMSRRDIAAELDQSQALLPKGCVPAFLQPPGGCCSDAVRQVAQAKNLAILGWSVDPRDWSTQDTAAIEKAVLKNVRSGDIVLLHDMSDSSVRAALDIIDALLAQNYEIVTVSRLARLREQKLRPGHSYANFPESPKIPRNSPAFSTLEGGFLLFSPNSDSIPFQRVMHFDQKSPQGG